MTPTDNLPLPRGGSAFGVPARRERIIAMLTEAYARNELEQQTFEQRVERAERCGTLEELDELIADFPPEARAAYGSPARSGTQDLHAPVTSPEEIERAVAELDRERTPARFTLIGDQHLTVRPGDPRVARSVQVIGDMHLDLRPLSGQPGVFLLKIAGFIGDTKLTVPVGTEVQVRSVTVIGDQTRKAKGGGFLSRIRRRLGLTADEPEAPPGPPGPVVVVTGFRLIGDLIIEER